MRLGVTQFGNGEIMDDGTASDTLLIQKLTNEMAKATTSIEGLEYKTGFIDMAQALKESASHSSFSERPLRKEERRGKGGVRWCEMAGLWVVGCAGSLCLLWLWLECSPLSGCT